jgi:predicted DNA binding protein
MVIRTRVYVEHPDLALSHTIRSCPDTTIGVVSDAGTDPQHDAYFFWVEAPEFDRVDAALAEDHTVASFTDIVETGGRRTYRIEYTDEALLLSPTVTDIGGLVLDTESHENGWMLRLELADHESLYRLHEYASEADIRLDVLDIQQTTESDGEAGFGLTESQTEALVAAYVNGFYDEPRDISLDGLASMLDISQSAVSGRLRRGSARLIEEILIDDEE